LAPAVNQNRRGQREGSGRLGALGFGGGKVMRVATLRVFFSGVYNLIGQFFFYGVGIPDLVVSDIELIADLTIELLKEKSCLDH
jgi:hypothetical protein